MKNKKTILMLSILCTMAWTSMASAASSIDGDVIEYDFRNGQAIATGNVVLTNDGGKATAKGAEYNTKTENGKLTGSVVADKDDAHLTCHTLNIAEAGDHLTAVGNAVLKKADKTLRAQQVEYYGKRQYAETVGNWAQLALDDGSTMDSANMNYDMKNGLAHANGNVRLISPPRKLTARADKAIYNTQLEDGTINLIGHATATQDGNTVSGNTLTLKGAGGKIAIAEGNVKLVYVPKEEQSADTTPLISEEGKGNYGVYKVTNWPGEKITEGNQVIA